MSKIAAIQMISTPDVDENIATAAQLINTASKQGANLVLLPEYWAIMGMTENDKVGIAETLDNGPIQAFMSNIAKQHSIYLLGGTAPLQAPDPKKVLNTALVYNPEGERICRYDKIHLFSYSKDNESYDESRTIMPGESVASFESPWGKVGLSVCYDLRFPELFRALGKCTLLTLPAAFTYTTGKPHWEVLLRARAIENQCYVLASGQGGSHKNGRQTFGHSMIINPWGEIIDILPQGEGFVIADLDLDLMNDIRERLPALNHRKL